MSYSDLIVTRPYRRAMLLPAAYIDDVEIAKSLGGPLRFAELMLEAELLDEVARLGLRARRDTLERARINLPDGGVMLGLEVLADGLPPDERLPRRRRRKP